ncbi:GNAT family N-acetyltransferase, partial [Streptomyces collinus]
MKSNFDPYLLRAGSPSVETYLRLRVASGLSAKTMQAAEAGLPNTWHGVTVLYGDEPVGMGRVIGDGGCFFQIVDICVTPEHQGRGLGKRIMAALVDELQRRAPDGAYVSLSSFSVATDRVAGRCPATHEAPVPLREVFDV